MSEGFKYFIPQLIDNLLLINQLFISDVLQCN